MATSQSERTSKTGMVQDERPQMPIDIFTAALIGDSDVPAQLLGLHEQEQNYIQVHATNRTLQQMNTENNTVRSNLHSVTEFGDTVLHLLITNGHYELALKVFRKDMFLLKAQNNELETPLHCLARAGNETVVLELIKLNSKLVKDVLAITNDKGDTALHIAARYGNKEAGLELMKMDPKMAYKVNKEKSYPLYLALVNGYTKMVQSMLTMDNTLACIPNSDRMYPVHVAARMGDIELVNDFMEKYPNYAELLDPRGRNLFHIAAENNQVDIFLHADDMRDRKMLKRMNFATDYDGNTPLHIAAMMGQSHYYVMRAIWEKNLNHVAQEIRNKHGLTPLELSAKHLVENSERIKLCTERRINEYFKTKGRKTITYAWFKDVMRMSHQNNWAKIQVVGLGSVLITTVSFAAAFTLPGGYNQDKGTPILARKYTFKAFILANASAFIMAFLSVFTLLVGASRIPYANTIRFAIYMFLLASSSMVVAFGLGLYTTLAPNNTVIAILILVLTVLLGSPVAFLVVSKGQEFHGFVQNYSTNERIIYLFNLVSYGLPLLFIFYLALL